MTFAYIKGSLAAWANNTTISQADAWQLDQNQKNAIDGAAGGAYAPSGTITIGGAGIAVSGRASFSGTFTGTTASFTSHLTANGNVNFGATATTGQFNGSLLVVGATELDGGLEVYGSAYTHGTTEFLGSATFGVTATFSAPIVATSTAQFDGNVSFNSYVALGATAGNTIALYGSLHEESSGRIVHNLISDSIAANVSYSVSNPAHHYVGYSAIYITDLGGASRDLRLYADGAVSGMPLEVKLAAGLGTATLNVKDSLGGALTSMGTADTYRFMFDGTDWVVWS